MNETFLNFLLQDTLLRCFISLSFSCALSYLGIKLFLCYVNKRQICRQPIRAEGPEAHLQNKKNTPTMGGIFIVLSTLITSLIFLDLKNPYILAAITVFFSFSLIGLTDDILKVFYKNPQGFRGSIKLIIQFLITSGTILWLGYNNLSYLNGKIFLPFASGYFLTVGLAIYLLFVTFVIVGSSNAVNLTDGLDGLVSIPAIINLICLCVIIFVVSDFSTAKSFNVSAIDDSQELMLFCSSLIGSIIGFLIFNLKPAKIFMGDVGSLAIGSTLGLIAIITKQELVFFVISLLFVIEAVSVILQVSSYKLRKKRIFLMAPIHHHFEKLGWSEKKVVRSFWTASLLFATLGMIVFFNI